MIIPRVKIATSRWMPAKRKSEPRLVRRRKRRFEHTTFVKCLGPLIGLIQQWRRMSISSRFFSPRIDLDVSKETEKGCTFERKPDLLSTSMVKLCGNVASPRTSLKATRICLLPSSSIMRHLPIRSLQAPASADTSKSADTGWFGLQSHRENPNIHAWSNSDWAEYSMSWRRDGASWHNPSAEPSVTKGTLAT